MRGLPKDSVNCVITSPPYFALRSYSTYPEIWGGRKDCKHKWGETSGVIAVGNHSGGNSSTLWGGRKKLRSDGNVKEASTGSFCLNCNAWMGELGNEPTKKLYVEHLVSVCRAIRRVLKPDGIFFLNLGDSYKDKQLVGIPWRVAFALQDDGWILRSEIIWQASNKMPESVTDRVTRQHEHIFMLTKTPDYKYYSDAVKEPCVSKPGGASFGKVLSSDAAHNANAQARRQTKEDRERYVREGRNLRSVWSIPTESLHLDHFAAFPKALVARCLLASTVKGDSVLDPFGGCYDDETYVLTYRGWKLFKNTNQDDLFATRTPGGVLEYHKSTAKQEFIYSGDMIRIKSRSTDLLVTPNHNMLVRTHADYCAGRVASLHRADSLDLKSYKIPNGASFKGSIHLTPDFMFLIGLYVSEGYFNSNNRIIICQNPGEKWNKMWDMLARFNPKRRDHRRIRVHPSKSQMRFIRENCGSSKYHKFLSPTLLSSDNLQSLYDGMMLGDGSKGWGKEVYYTVSRGLRDGFQELCMKLGKETTTTVRLPEDDPRIFERGVGGRRIIATVPCYSINVRMSKDRKLYPREHFSTVNYDGFVYCVTVPNHTLYVRRNGYTTWCGNSGTVSLVAERMGRNSTYIDLNSDYVRLAQHRVLTESTGGILQGKQSGGIWRK
jgi:DNA modification methylase